MMNARYLLLPLLLPLLATGIFSAQYQGYPIVVFDGAPAIPAYPACGVSAFGITQTDTQKYTIECVNISGHTSVKSGLVTATGQGACRGFNGGACLAGTYHSGSPAPQFQGGWNGVINIWLATDSIPLAGPDQNGF